MAGIDGLIFWQCGIHLGGFEQLYDQLPGDKPGFEYIWRITGGNPKLLAELYKVGWDVDRVLKELINEKR